MFLPRWDSKGWTPANNQRNTYSCWVLPSPLSPKIPLLPWAWASVNEQCHLEITHPPAPRPRFPILGPLVCFRAVYLCWVESYTDRAEAHLVQDPQPDRLKMEHTCLEQANKADFAWIQIQVSGDTVQSHQPGLMQDTANGGKLPAATNLTCKSMIFYQVKLDRQDKTYDKAACSNCRRNGMTCLPHLPLLPDPPITAGDDGGSPSFTSLSCYQLTQWILPHLPIHGPSVGLNNVSSPVVPSL